MAGTFTPIASSTDVDGSYIDLNIDQKLTAGQKLLKLNAEAQMQIIELQALSVVTPIVGDEIQTDVFTDADGYLDTVNSTGLTAVYNEDDDQYEGGTGVPDFVDDLTLDTDSFTNPENAYDSDDDTYAVKTASGGGEWIYKELGKTFDAKYVKWCSIKLSNSGSSAYKYVAVLKYNGTSWVEVTSYPTSTSAITKEETIEIDDTIQGLKVIFGTRTSGTADSFKVYSLEYGIDGDSRIPIDLDTFSGTVVGIMLVGDSNVPLTFDVTNGTTTLEDQEADTLIDWSGSSNPNLLTIRLDNSGDTPTIKKYGVIVWLEA